MNGNGQVRITDLSFRFSVDIIKYCEKLNKVKQQVIANQLLRSGTAIGALVHEAQNAESRKDFIHKMKIALKEAEETEYWLNLSVEVSNIPDCQNLNKEIRSIILVLAKIITSSLRNQNPPKPEQQ
ncbi:MAG: four helix bundle protein [Bacteroidota bacterium]